MRSLQTYFIKQQKKKNDNDNTQKLSILTILSLLAHMFGTLGHIPKPGFPLHQFHLRAQETLC